MESEPQTFVDGKLVISTSKCWQVEIWDFLMWTEAFSIFQMVTYGAFSNSLSNLTGYKLLNCHPNGKAVPRSSVA